MVASIDVDRETHGVVTDEPSVTVESDGLFRPRATG